MQIKVESREKKKRNLKINNVDFDFSVFENIN